jgi:ComF family protein
VCEEPARPVVCETCAGRLIVPIPDPICPTCGRPHEPSGVACRHCEAQQQADPRGWGFATARAAGIYEGPLRYAIHRLKYAHIEALGQSLGALLANRLVVDGLLAGPPPQAVVPIPIHAARRRKRGFNQAALLAAPVAEMLGVPLLESAARRTRATAPQVGLAPEVRRTNLADAFVVPDPALVAGKRVLLIDDVFTTGATGSACAHALKDAGAARVDVATLAAGG